MAAAVAVASFSAQAAAPKGKEACHGVSPQGHNDCAGKSTASYDGGDFKYVPAGACAKMHVHGHMGSLTPV